MSYENLEIDFKQRQVTRDGQRIELTKIEFAVGEIDNSIYCLVRSLRKKLEPDPDHPKHILTVRGVGYRFEPA